MKMFTAIFISFLFIYGAFSLFNGVDSADQTSLTTESVNKNKTVEKSSEEIKQSVKVQILKAIITFDYGLVPSSFNVKVNVPVRLEIDPKDDIEGCMSTIMIPGLYDKPILIKAEKKIVMEFIPKRAGLYDITCAMGVPWGDLRVE